MLEAEGYGMFEAQTLEVKSYGGPETKSFGSITCELGNVEHAFPIYRIFLGYFPGTRVQFESFLQLFPEYALSFLFSVIR